MIQRTVLASFCVCLGCAAEQDLPQTEPQKEQLVVGFEAFVDPANDTMQFRVGARGLAPVTVDQDGTPGTGAASSVELVTTRTANDIDGSGTCGYASSFCGDVTIRSFYGVPLANVFAEITSITPPTGHEGLNSDPAPPGLSNLWGLWGYGTIASGGTNDRLWVFGDTGVPYIVRGRVMADVLQPGVWNTSTWDNAVWQ